MSPILVLFVLLEATCWEVGQTWPMSRAARWQDHNPAREWRSGDNRSYFAFKLARVRYLRPDVVFLGHSRANMVRARKFRPYSFYNAGFSVYTFDEYRRFIELATAGGYAPKVLIFNLDFFQFAAGYPAIWTHRFQEHATDHAADLKYVIDRLLKTPVKVIGALPGSVDYAGLYAVVDRDGFRNDGSLKGWPRDTKTDGMRAGVRPFFFEDRMADSQVVAFRRFIAAAKSRGIALIGIQLPYYRKILNGLDDMRMGIWRDFESRARHGYFKKKGVVFFDFADMPEFRDKSSLFLDSAHPGPVIVDHVENVVAADPRVRALLPKLGTAK